jgi:Flp pilus assembly protein TadD
MAANNLAWHLLLQERVAEALPHAERALKLAPGDPMVLDTYAGVLEATGDCRGALDVADRAVELLPDGASDAQRAPWVKRVERLERRCGRASGAPAPARPPAAASG